MEKIKSIDHNVKIKEVGGVLGRGILHFLMKYFGRVSVKLITFPIICYFLIRKKDVRDNMLKYWSTLNPKHHKIKHFINIYKHYSVFGETLLDRLTNRCKIHNEDQDKFILEQSNKKQGVILLCSHIGGYNFFRFDFGGRPIHVMMHEEVNENRFSMFDSSHEGKVKFINPTDPNAVFKSAQVLLDGGVLAIMGDRAFNPNDKYIREVDLLGLKRKFPLGPFHIAYSTESAIICMFIVKRDKEYHLIAKEPITMSQTGKKKQQIQNAFNEYISYLKDIVTEYPYQWFNFTG